MRLSQGLTLSTAILVIFLLSIAQVSSSAAAANCFKPINLRRKQESGSSAQCREHYITGRALQDAVHNNTAQLLTSLTKFY